ncbi:DUF3331 domain-containing protein [Paraburkholderia humisilvae]|uniref:DUF3331 domain-containing protein n=1 Tax=Paraburkholderia humisilvae TaxID=627669 RepID=A0A6J5EHP2_9BURK|nr:DUF3331 domain-containing protein [Paraburkholderia humisilvae]CAB3764796.1 hypothetical protein LMG29542_04958 [Paraburkholderia humisilvae]
MSDVARCDPWSQTLNLLSSLSHGATGLPRPRRLKSCAARAPSAASCTGTARLVERVGERLLTVSWSDPTSCCYPDQPWVVAIARRDGVCALSGQPISYGDPIFRPRAAKLMPTNAQAMMLASAVNAAMPAPPPGCWL